MTSSISKALTREDITRFDDFRDVRSEWNSLLEPQPRPNPALRHEWLEAWWDGFGHNATPHVVLLRDGGRLVAGAAFVVSWRQLCKIRVRALHSMAIDLAVGDFLLTDRIRESVCMLAVETFQASRCDVAIIRGVTDGSDRDRALRDALIEARVAYHCNPYDEVSIDTSAGVDAYTKARRSKFMANIRNRKKRIAKEGDVAFRRHCGASDVEQVMRDVFDVDARSWKGVAGTAIGSQPEYRRAYTRLVELLGSREEADVCFLTVDGRPIAYRLGYRAGAVFYEAEIAFDESWKRFSPGTLLAGEHNPLLIEEGVQEIALGSYFTWKNEWSPEVRTLNEFVLYGRHPRAIAARTCQRLRNQVVKLTGKDPWKDDNISRKL